MDLVSSNDALDRLSLCHHEELHALIESELIIQHPTKVYHLSLAPVEVYSAGSLSTLSHQRIVKRVSDGGKARNDYSEADCHEYIGSRVIEYIDAQNVIHVARPHSSIFTGLGSILGDLDVGLLVKTIVENGQPSKEDGRSPDSIRWHLAAAGQGYNAGSTRPTSNVGFNCKLLRAASDKEEEGHRDGILKMVGRIASFVWECLQAMQDRAGQPRLGTNRHRNEFSAVLRKLLKIKHPMNMGFESITMAIMEIFPNIPRNEEHIDKFNCRLATSERTGGFDIVLIDSRTNRLYLLQFLFNFRIQITNYIMPYYSAVNNLTRNIKSLVHRIQQQYNQLYAGQQMMSDLPTPLDRTGFFLDDSLAFEVVQLQTNDELKETHPVPIDVVQIPIGFSRTMSLSSAISSLNKSFHFLAYDQVVELCFVCSLLNTPLRFHLIMESLLKKAQMGGWEFQVHPFYDWLEMTISIFRSWQGGPFHRYSPFGVGDIAELFVPSEDGRARLSKIVKTLLDFLCWVDGLSGKNAIADLPIHFLKQKMLEVCAAVRSIHPAMEFNLFRLGIFLTHANGCRLTKSGPHLRNIFFPITGMASYNHLKDATGDVMPHRESIMLAGRGNDSLIGREEDHENPFVMEGINEQNFDDAMTAVSEEFGERTFFRDTWEVAICESKHSRELGLVDSFVRGVPLYDINERGEIVVKSYGRHSRWQTFHPSDRQRDYSILQNQHDKEIISRRSSYFYYQPKGMALSFICREVGNQLRCGGRNKGRQSGIQLGETYKHNHSLPQASNMRHYSFRTSYYFEDNISTLGPSSPTNDFRMKVLGNGNFGVAMKSCTTMHSEDGMGALCEIVRQSVPGLENNDMKLAAECHQQVQPEKGITFFEVHKDKICFEFATFLPLSGEFWTLVAIPDHCMDNATSICGTDIFSSAASFDTWLGTLDTKQQEQVILFKEQLQSVAAQEMGQVSICAFHCTVGSLLCFPAHMWYHGTITVTSDQLIPRDVMIFYPLVKTS
eukprot:scaffold4064_cov145-Cylindrotheca_fusiformis.AAC.2